jgi:hypothetical protein
MKMTVAMIINDDIVAIINIGNDNIVCGNMCNDNETANVAMAMVTANNGLAMSMTVTA